MYNYLTKNKAFTRKEKKKQEKMKEDVLAG